MKEITEKLEKAWKCRVHVYPRGFSLDAWAEDPDGTRVLFFGKFRHRSVPRLKFEFLHVNWRSIAAALAVCVPSSIPGYLFVQFDKEPEVWYIELEVLAGLPPVPATNAKTERREPVVSIPIRDLKPLF